MIETARLLLRTPLPGDAVPLHADPDRLRARIGVWETNGLGYFTVLRGGEIDSRPWELASYADAGEQAETELGWTLVPEHRGRGYALEAALAARAWAALQRLISLIEPENARSIRVAERLGASPGEAAESGGDPHVVWGHP